jgi:hypothetical protein
VRHVSGHVLCRCGARKAVADGEVKVKEDMPCRWTGGVKDGREAWTEGPEGQVASRGG